MHTLQITPADKAREVIPLVQAAVESEISRLELALELARERLAVFERKYHVPSEHFMEKMFAEDLEEGDDEYVQWAGEYQLMQRLATKIAQLRSIRYSD